MLTRLFKVLCGAAAAAAIGCAGSGSGAEQGEEPAGEAVSAERAEYPSGNTVFAHVVAIDQVYVYERFGAFNPAGMIYALRRDVVAADPERPIGPGNAMLRPDKRPRPLVLRVNVGDALDITFTNWLTPPGEPLPEPAPLTRDASIHVAGLQIRDIESLGGNVGRNPSSLAAPGETRTYRLFADREGTFLMHSAGAMAGGDAPGPPIRQAFSALFGAVHVEPRDAVAYRSQVTAAELAAASLGRNPDGTPRLDYEAIGADGEPILRITNDAGEIVHGDVNAIIAGYGDDPSSRDTTFREITVVFHDDLGAVNAFPELNLDTAFHSVRSGFGVNYGAASLGAAVLANRRRIGPTRACAECKFEEFFLSSWANGDPALNIERDELGNAVRALYPDDPSNVHHGYLGDPVWFRNVHAGPRETHVFHLHAHQWLRTPDDEDSDYIDSQTIGPGAAFTYQLRYGAGNRHLTPGDSIFHCHLYPHFAQGMWGLLRVHDVFEAGTQDRALPDGELAAGTPTPAVVPLPGRAMAPMPTYAPTRVELPGGERVIREAMPGYPFYIAALAGHRASQPPRDMEHDGGLPRHVVTSVPADGVDLGVRGEFDVQIHRANLKLLPADGTRAESAAMAFHAGQFPGAARAPERYGYPVRGYPAFTPEGDAALFLVNGRPPAPGAVYADPCPSRSPTRTYRAAYVQLDGVVNGAGWHDAQLRTTILEGDYHATRDGAKAPEPLFIRARSGDCVVFHATNLLPSALQADDFQIYVPTDTTGQHIHLVKYDVIASDGGANGFNYEDGTFTADEVLERIGAANALGGALAADGTLEEAGRRVHLAAEEHPTLDGAPRGAQITTQRFWADPIVNTHGRDRTLSTAFTHDHFSPSSHQHHGLYAGLVVEPAGSTWRDPETGALLGERSDGGPTSYRADILFPAGDPRRPFREFNLMLADYSLVYDECGRPVNPPTFVRAPLPLAIVHPPDALLREVISWRDPGTQLINYRNEPIPLRIAERRCAADEVAQRAGEAGEMHNVFSSRVHGDPSTPLLRAYPGDHTMVRLVHAAQAEQHVFSIHGRKWLRESASPDSGYVNGQPIGVSEKMDLDLTDDVVSGAAPAGGVDYLYQSAATDDLWDGMWGLLRVHGERVPDLLPLPGAPEHAGATPAPVCPPDAEVRRYVVHAITARGNLPGGRLTYNEEFGFYDPDALLFVREEDLGALRAGKLQPEPLLLRAAAGDCVEVTLVNDLPEELPKTPHWNYNPPIVDGFNTNQVRPSNHVSLHPQLVAYDVSTSDGANVGRNPPQTVPPGQRRTYTWYAGEVTSGPDGVVWRPLELGAVNLKDMADVVNHGMHGAIGALVVEPEGAVWYEKPGLHAQAWVAHGGEGRGAQWFRELVLVYQAEVGLHTDEERFQCADPSWNCGTALANLGGEIDWDVSGQEAFNYRSEPIWARLGVRPETRLGSLVELDQSEVFSSAAHGDPATPVFEVGRWDKLRVRVLFPSGHRRQLAFSLWGHEWPHNPWALGSASRAMGENPTSFAIGVQSGIGPMTAWNINPFYRAGGRFGVPGDRLYNEQNSVELAGGQWGLVRVLP
ncbi:multicopper oxidase [Sorangium cellulosum]|uniref:Multicopper oxidase n=1 Tax=Sorangium cellulosum TaxID=56 RepID=A0A2L0EK93_SORCE|nr:copper oxidase [Sorangium cellulosum]AUX39699.1 multicopper oxidase [Sorangium cellulosum]